MRHASACTLAPELLAATGNLVSVLSPADLAANQSHLERFELAVETVQQNARGLGPRVHGRGRSASQRLRAVFRTNHPRTAGRGPALGVVAVQGDEAQSNLEAATRTFEETRNSIGTIVANADQLDGGNCTRSGIRRRGG